MTCPYCCESLGTKGTVFSGSAHLPEGPADLRRGADLYTKTNKTRKCQYARAREEDLGERRSGGGEARTEIPPPPTCLWMPHLESETQGEPGASAQTRPGLVPRKQARIGPRCFSERLTLRP